MNRNNTNKSVVDYISKEINEIYDLTGKHITKYLFLKLRDSIVFAKADRDAS